MQCPHCESSNHRVIDTRMALDSIRRRRQCNDCNMRFTTYENIAADLLVVKSGGRREPFDRQKLLSGIQTAATKRPVSSSVIENITKDIEESLQRIGKAEVSSRVLGKMVLDRLVDLDPVTYIRFASVCLDIKDLADLRDEIDHLMGR